MTAREALEPNDRSDAQCAADAAAAEGGLALTGETASLKRQMMDPLKGETASLRKPGTVRREADSETKSTTANLWKEAQTAQCAVVGEERAALKGPLYLKGPPWRESSSLHLLWTRVSEEVLVVFAESLGDLRDSWMSTFFCIA